MNVCFARTTIVAVAVVYSFNLFAKNIYFFLFVALFSALAHSRFAFSSIHSFVRSFCAHTVPGRRHHRHRRRCYSLIFIIIFASFFIFYISLCVAASAVVVGRFVVRRFLSVANECHMIVCCCLCFAVPFCYFVFFIL